MRPSSLPAALTCAALLLASLAACGPDDATPEAAPAVDLAPVVAEVQRLHPTLHTPGGEGADAQEALVRRFAEQTEDLLATRRRFIEQAGPCRLVCAGQPTPAGRALLKALTELERHGLQPTDYGMPELEARLKRHAEALKSRVTLPPDAAEAGPVLLEHLARRRLDPDALTQALRALPTPPRPEHVAAIADQLRAARADEANQREEASLEADLTRALLQLVFDLRFANTTGPQPLTRKNKKTEDKLGDAMLQRMLAIVDAPEPAKALQRLFPIALDYARLLELRDQYQARADKGGCPDLPKAWTFSRGARPAPEVARLKARLQCEGYDPGPEGEAYTDALQEAVKRYQRHHDLEETGWIGEDDLKSLNVPMSERTQQLTLAALRLREDREDELGDLYLRVNLPAFRLDVVDFGKNIRSQRVIIGTNKLDDNKLKLIQGHINRTPLLRTSLTQIVANPDWILPTRVQKGEVVGKLEDDPEYLQNKGIKKVTLDNGREVLVQERGDDNVLGQAKFVLQGTNAIYLHDTNDPWLFNARYRALSHGCMRVHEATDFAQWLLTRDGWDAAEVKDVFSERKRRVQRGMDLRTPLPFISVYRTVELSPEGLPVFLSDVYRYDKAYFEGEIPPLEQTRWGDARLRPPWVPRTPREVVDRWRAEGKPAPRDYDPAKDTKKEKKKK